MNGRYRAILVGCGNIGAAFSCDPVMARHIRYACHAQVLAAHEAFSWVAAVDPDESALHGVASCWDVPILARSLDELPGDFRADLAVIATPPQARAGVMGALGGLRAVFVEKPLGVDLAAAEAFVAESARAGLLVQTNFWRRGDALSSRLASGELERLIGEPRAACGVYGNGLKNNGSHMIDYVRMLLGEICRAEVLDREGTFSEGPIVGDKNVSFALKLQRGLTVTFQAIPFRSYRENGLEIWGDRGRLAIMQEGLGVFFYPRRPNRAITDEWEIATDEPQPIPHTCGEALYRMYDNLAAALDRGERLVSGADSALVTERIVHALARSC